MRSLVRSALIATLFVAVGTPAAQAQSATDEKLLRRIDSLERRIVALEGRIAALEGAARNEPPRARAVDGRSEEIANWRRLRERMTYDQVRSLLGEPEKIAGGSLAFWFYLNGGQVTFSSGRVSSWSEPSRTNRQ